MLKLDLRHRKAKGDRSKRNGFVLISAAIGMVAILGMTGLAVDLGRVYVTKSELQGFTDSAAMAAGYELDGTLQGITNARNVAQNGFGGSAPPNRWNFATQSVSTPQVSFASSYAGPYVASPASGSGVIFVKISVSQSLPYYFLPILPGVPSTGVVNASATAGQAVSTSLGDGLAPFSPDAHDPADPNFGFTRGQEYTLKWPPPGQRTHGKGCSGDKTFDPGGSSDRGYVDVGQGSGNSHVSGAIIYNDFFLPLPISIGTTLSTLPGNGSVDSAMQQRFDQDSDTGANNYSSYTGNGRRVMIVAVNNHSDPPVVAGFGAFFLHPNACGNGNTAACCGEYIGPGLEFARHQGGSTTGGLYVVRLFQ